MQINPGGRLNIEGVIGRDHEIDRYWRVLERQGLVLSAERRIGKTHVLLKMSEECRPGYLPVYQDLEAVHSIDYVNRLSQYYTDSQRSLARLLLDTIARQPAPIPVPTLLNLCKDQKQSLDDEQFRVVLALLAEDHYIEPATSFGPASYDFRWQLVKRWWARTRR